MNLGKDIRLWSVCSPKPKLFIVTREDKAPIPTGFSDDDTSILAFIRFFWFLKVVCYLLHGNVPYSCPDFQQFHSMQERLQQTLCAIKELKVSNKERMRNYRFEDAPIEADLPSLVNPKIIKLTEKIHASLLPSCLLTSSSTNDT